MRSLRNILFTVVVFSGGGFMIGKSQSNAKSNLDGQLSACSQVVSSMFQGTNVTGRCEEYKGEVVIEIYIPGFVSDQRFHLDGRKF
jgi:hypothetical protein